MLSWANSNLLPVLWAMKSRKAALGLPDIPIFHPYLSAARYGDSLNFLFVPAFQDSRIRK
jgi:hypothetical protein